jgi:hypothetical protein
MGMPRLRQVYVPQPVVDRSAADLRAYIEGHDPVSGRPFMQEVLEGLTAPLTSEDLQGLTFERTTPRLLEPDGDDDLHRLFEENHWTDGLPIVLPTEARVDAMLGGSSRPPDQIVGRLRPTAFREFWEFTVEKVAVNAVMAGARPEYFPVILALASSGISARSSSTNSFATISVINGPIRSEIGMHSGIGVMLRAALAESPGWIDSGRHLHGLARELVRVHGGPPRSRGAKSVAAAARAEGIPAG